MSVRPDCLRETPRWDRSAAGMRWTTYRTIQVVDLFCGRGGVGYAVADAPAPIEPYLHAGFDIEDYSDTYPGRFGQVDLLNADLPVEASEDELRRAVQRLTRRYRERWTIENGYKSLKSFVVPTTSKSHSLRYFNFLFACLLFNVWKLVDLLLRQLFGVEDGPILPAAQVLAAVRRATGVG